MDTKKLLKFCIYCTLMTVFIIQIIFAFENLVSEKTTHTIQPIKEPITMPSMTICPYVDTTKRYVSAKNVLSRLKNSSLNMSVIYQHKSNNSDLQNEVVVYFAVPISSILLSYPKKSLSKK